MSGDGIDQSGTHVALVSGGMDSTVAAHVAVEDHGVDLLAYLDTGTGLDENREYIERLADHLGVQLWTLRTHESYEEKVQEHGFPGPSRHTMMYSSLKERQIGKLATVCNGYGNTSDLHLWTGVRADESERRMAHVERVQEADRWTWVAPIHDWSKAECRHHVESHDLPKNPLWGTLGRSGDCFCGCFGNPEEKLDLRAAGCDYHADWIEDLETAVDTNDETERWAWGALSEKEQRGAAAEADDGQMFLCSSCEGFVARTDGGNSVSRSTDTDRSD
jgi:3'-phosphoadenosine 5'-phosphosulfate sulfotransferase (PAPS reductase)/FAD synthetase